MASGGISPVFCGSESCFGARTFDPFFPMAVVTRALTEPLRDSLDFLSMVFMRTSVTWVRSLEPIGRPPAFPLGGSESKSARPSPYGPLGPHFLLQLAKWAHEKAW